MSMLLNTAERGGFMAALRIHFLPVLLTSQQCPLFYGLQKQEMAASVIYSYFPSNLVYLGSRPRKGIFSLPEDFVELLCVSPKLHL